MSDNTLYSSAIVPAAPGPAPAANRKNQPFTPGLNYLDIRIPDINDPAQQAQVEGLKKIYRYDDYPSPGCSKKANSHRFLKS